jgi:hypothetical protein
MPSFNLLFFGLGCVAGVQTSIICYVVSQIRRLLRESLYDNNEATPEPSTQQGADASEPSLAWRDSGGRALGECV